MGTTPHPSVHTQSTSSVTIYQQALTSAHHHGIRAIDAIHNALNGNPWLPTVSTA